MLSFGRGLSQHVWLLLFEFAMKIAEYTYIFAYGMLSYKNVLDISSPAA